ncbi:hypothetical protein [Bradyrhizobium sp. F1.13.3]|uniref:hypothetical protein n=1 Tax=Bradyrhizobium sp. F1.13.3 TaxID=3156351 RepID=UPI00339670A4
MTDLQPHRYSASAAPLSAGARFIRGFTRIGAVLALLVTLIGLATSIFIAIDRSNSAETSYRSATCLVAMARTGYKFPKKEYSRYPDYSDTGCAGYSYHSYNTISEVTAIADAPAPTFLTGDGPSVLGWGLIITGIVAVVTYLAFWALGWLCAGFTRDA